MKEQGQHPDRISVNAGHSEEEEQIPLLCSG